MGSLVPELGWSEVFPEPHRRTYLFAQLPHMAEVALCVNGGVFCNQKVYRWSGTGEQCEFPGYNFGKLQVRPHNDSATAHDPYCSLHSHTMLGAHPASDPVSWLRAPPSRFPPPNGMACLLVDYSTKNVPLASVTGQTLRRTISSMGLFQTPCSTLRQCK